MMKGHIFLDAESYAEYISLQVNNLHFIRYPRNVENGFDWEKNLTN